MMTVDDVSRCLACLPSHFLMEAQGKRIYFFPPGTEERHSYIDLETCTFVTRYTLRFQERAVKGPTRG